MSLEALEEIHFKMSEEAREGGGDITAIYHCLHGWDDNCDCRKPRPGMLLQAQKDFALNLHKTPFIGDDSRDQQAANAVDSPFYYVNESVSLQDNERTPLISTTQLGSQD